MDSQSQHKVNAETEAIMYLDASLGDSKIGSTRDRVIHFLPAYGMYLVPRNNTMKTVKFYL